MKRLSAKREHNRSLNAAFLCCVSSLKVGCRCVSPISVRIACAIHHHIPILDFSLLHILDIRMLLRTSRCRHQIHEECQDIECEHERNDPLEHGCDILLVVETRGGKDDSKTDFDEDEEEFGPEAEAEDAVLAEVHAKTLVFGADEDGAYYIAGYKEEEEAVVQMRVV